MPRHPGRDPPLPQRGRRLRRRRRAGPARPPSSVRPARRDATTDARSPRTSPARVPDSRTASGSRAVVGAKARVARASRILVEGVHDAELVEKVWGDDLRIEGVVVERLDGADHLADALAGARAPPGRRVGVLLDHLVPGNKESRIAARSPTLVLVTGTPYVDVWEAVRPRVIGIDAWPEIPKGIDWKTGVSAALGVADARRSGATSAGSVHDWNRPRAAPRRRRSRS